MGLSDDQVQALLRLASDSPSGVTVTDAAAALGWTVQRAWSALYALDLYGYLSESRRSDPPRFSITDLGRTQLD